MVWKGKKTVVGFTKKTPKKKQLRGIKENYSGIHKKRIVPKNLALASASSRPLFRFQRGYSGPPV